MVVFVVVMYLLKISVLGSVWGICVLQKIFTFPVFSHALPWSGLWCVPSDLRRWPSNKLGLSAGVPCVQTSPAHTGTAFDLRRGLRGRGGPAVCVPCQGLEPYGFGCPGGLEPT